MARTSYHFVTSISGGNAFVDCFVKGTRRRDKALREPQLRRTLCNIKQWSMTTIWVKFASFLLTFEILVESVDPLFPVSVVGSVTIPDERALHALWIWHRAEPNSWKKNNKTTVSNMSTTQLVEPCRNLRSAGSTLSAAPPQMYVVQSLYGRTHVFISLSHRSSVNVSATRVACQSITLLRTQCTSFTFYRGGSVKPLPSNKLTYRVPWRCCKFGSLPQQCMNLAILSVSADS